ncbi:MULTISPECIES: TonB-dependent receptor [unclassified Lysobacter]|uniref:TonB-dependent receptor domain-containing protein n=1 Tax=unclassified Lysobacter TaxID=2635362 RepID=UPI001BE5A32D|nr:MULTISPECIES: TonB-dependent receptor [unclassified Lysobacter]MBT2748094.1 TonB-dependent receptor [Lysobacter sp. ISL-42]MBT2754134.1 TonB-dependent receptor [Lysobacter sp. ISL-50]MBT2776040.1 TonB-dependent receptor [Lysobacter sp. ISL-54]MBT2784121.1 TonB-dependent receptor [Lysobacter sp. ISL-52]
MTTTSNGRALRRRPLLIAIAFAMAAPGFAVAGPQDAQTSTAPAAAPAERATTELEGIQVTASRIPRTGFDSLEPATVINGDAVRERGVTNIADALNQTVGFGVGQTPEGGQGSFAGGVNFVNRFGLGSNRTLTLINGRRVVTSRALTNFGFSAGAQVDLNAIPVQMIDRVENVAIGGAPTYGSDAIAGVVNVILKDRFQGAEVNFNYGISDQSDNQTMGYNFVAGSDFADGRGNVIVSGSYDESEGLVRSDRTDFARAYAFPANPNAAQMATNQPGRTPGNDGRVNPDIPFDTGPEDGIPGTVLIRNARTFTTTFGGLLLPAGGAITSPGGALVGFGANKRTYLQFAPNGDIVPYDPGINFGTSTASGGQGLNTADITALLTSLQRQSVNVIAHYDVADNVRLFVEAMHYHSEADPPVDIASTGNTTAGTRLNSALLVKSDHPLLNAQARQQLAGLGVSSFRLARTSADLGLTPDHVESDIDRIVVGARGDFDLWTRQFDWEVSANYGRMQASTSSVSLNQQNFINAINVRNVGGKLVCDPTARNAVYLASAGANSEPIADPNCVPLDLFGQGRPSKEAINYVTGRAVTDFEQKQKVFSAFMHGNLVDLWSGPLNVAVGYEHRIEEGGFTPNDFTRRGLGRSVAIPALNGKFHTNEYYAEALLPLVSEDADIPGLHRLDITGKFRRVDNSVNGGFNAYTYGLQWEPIPGLLVRGNKTRSLRAPVITELFLPQVELFQSTSDPCDRRNVTGGPAPAVRARNCAAFYQQYGLNPVDFQQNASTARGARQGEPNLDNESADSWTAGVVWQPDFIRGLRMAVDYNEVKLKDQIFAQSINDVLSACYDNPDFNAGNVNTANYYCQQVQRRADGQFDIVGVRYRNGDFIHFQGITGELTYRWDAGDWGQFDFSANALIVKRFESSTTGVSVDDDRGEIGMAERQFQFGVDYQKGPVGLNLQGRYLSASVFDNENTVESSDILRAPAYWLFSAGANYRFGDNVVLRFNVQNLLDKDPPLGTTPGELGIGTYDVLGRRYNFSVTYRFN